MQNGKFLRHIDKAEQTGHKLREYRCITCSRDAHLKVENEEKVERHVEKRGENKKVKRRFAVAESAQNAGENVVQDIRKGAGKDYDDIVVGHADDILGGIHEFEKLPAKPHAQERHENAERDAEQGAHRHGVAHFLVVARPKALCDKDGEAACHAHNKAEDQKRKRSGGADGGKRVDAEKLPDNHGVHHAVQLLEEVADEKRDGKADDELDGVPDGHIPCHTNSLPSE